MARTASHSLVDEKKNNWQATWKDPQCDGPWHPACFSTTLSVEILQIYKNGRIKSSSLLELYYVLLIFHVPNTNSC